MAEYIRPTTEAQFQKNFKQKNPLMNPTEAYYESSRCLYCYDAPCINACPTGIDIPLFIKQIHTNNTTGAAKTIFESNWLGNACGKVCPTGVLCEGACVYNHQNVPAIQIGRLQNYATAHVMREKTPLFQAGSPKGQKVAIIGAGPAGIACACELRVLGYEVDIFEAKAQPSGLTIYGIAPYKITNEEVLDEVAYLQKQLEFSIKYNSPISSEKEVLELEKNYDAIFIGIGLGPTKELKMKGEEKENVVGAVEWIEALRMKHHQLQVPQKVVVIGGGNTAMDAASESARMGADTVILAYRRSKSRMGAYGFEYDTAISSGVKSLFNVQATEILGNEKVTGVRFIKTVEQNGTLENIPNSEFEVACDMVIKAIGQTKNANFLKKIKNLELDSRKRIKVNKTNFQTSNPKYFAGGDVINGGAEVVNACYDGKMAAKGIDQWLTLIMNE